MTSAGIVPDHVPRELVFSFNIFDDPRFRSATDPYAGVALLREEGAPGMFWSPECGGYWVIQDYELVFEAARSPDIFSNVRKQLQPRDDSSKVVGPASIPLMLDPPVHGDFRRPLQAAFSPKSIHAIEGHIRALAISLIDEFAGRGECDFFSAVAEPLPVTIFMILMGIPTEHLTEFRFIVRKLLGADRSQFMEAYAELVTELDKIIAARRNERRDDIISRLLDQQVYDRDFTDDELRGYCALLVIAGLDTVPNAMAYGVRHLAGDPALQSRLRKNPNDIPAATEELLRKYSVAQVGRRVAQDIEWKGIQLRENDRAILLIAAANTDAAVISRPHEVDIDRENNTHIAFNVGPHRCLGSHLARLELRIVYKELLARLPEFRADPGKNEKLFGTQIFGVESLPLAWDARPPR
jgi:cytochrome P450